MKNKKNIIIFIILLFTLIVIPKNVEADNEKRIKLCGYYNDVLDYAPDKNGKNWAWREVGLYINIWYHTDTAKWQITWAHPTVDSDGTRKGYSKTGLMNYLFSKDDENIYIDSIPSWENFQCPANAYIDLGGSVMELCFDDDGKYCKNKNNIGTRFGTGDDFARTTKTYDLDKKLQDYVEKELNYDDVDCLEIDSIETMNDYAEESKNFIAGFKKKYLNGFGMPDFLTKNRSYVMMSDPDYIKEIVDSKKSKCYLEVYEAKQNGQITEEAAEQLNDTLDSVDSEAIGEAMSQMLSTGLRANNASNAGLNQEIDCEGIFNFNEGHFGWLLQKILDYIKIIGPILVVILSALDFVKAVFSSDDKAMKQAQSKLVIRLCAAIALFLVPTIVSLLLQLINGISDPTCGFH